MDQEKLLHGPTKNPNSSVHFLWHGPVCQVSLCRSFAYEVAFTWQSLGLVPDQVCLAVVFGVPILPYSCPLVSRWYQYVHRINMLSYCVAKKMVQLMLQPLASKVCIGGWSRNNGHHMNFHTPHMYISFCMCIYIYTYTHTDTHTYIYICKTYT